jgi:hypothetical protein
MATEAGLVSRIVKAIKREYPLAWVFNVHGSPYQEGGIPDLLVCIDGYLLGLEVKHIKPGESREHALDRTTPLQRVKIARINAARGTADVVTSVEEAMALVRRGLERRREIARIELRDP